AQGTLHVVGELLDQLAAAHLVHAANRDGRVWGPPRPVVGRPTSSRRAAVGQRRTPFRAARRGGRRAPGRCRTRHARSSRCPAFPACWNSPQDATTTAAGNPPANSAPSPGNGPGRGVPAGSRPVRKWGRNRKYGERAGRGQETD